MKPLLIIHFLIFAIIIFSSKAVRAQWHQAKGLYGGSVSSIAINETDLYVGMFGGVYRSINNGNDWYPANSGMPMFVDISALAVSGTKIFACSYSDGVFVTTNNGADWIKTSLPDTAYSFAVGSPYIFAGTSKGVYRSNDNGISWAPVNVGMTYAVYDLVIMSTTLFAATDEGIFRSNNNGILWTQLTSEPTFALVANENSLFSGNANGISVSNNNGVNWTPTNSGISGFGIRDLAICGSTIYAGTFLEGVYISTNMGSSWQQVNSGITDKWITAIAVSGTNVYVGTWSGGVFLSTDNGSSWTQTKLMSNRVNELAVKDPILFAVMNDAVYRSNDNGESWKPLENSSYVSTLAVIGNSIFRGPYPNGIERSTDNGDSWLPVNLGWPGNSVPVIAGSETNIFASGYYGVYRSTDNGDSWTNAGLSNIIILALAVSGRTVFAGGLDGLIYRSTDFGLNWAPVYNSDDNLVPMIKVLAICGTTVFAGTGDGMLRSTDNGNNWEKVNTGLLATEINDIISIGNYVFVATWGGVFRSINNGQSWEPINLGLPSKGFFSLAASEKYLFAGTNCVWKRPIAEIATSADLFHEDLPNKYSLGQNYPNPCNPSTIISFNLPSASFVTLKIFDILGKNVVTLVSEDMPPGNYSRRWNASGMPSGMYFYRLQAGSYSDVKRLIILK